MLLLHVSFHPNTYLNPQTASAIALWARANKSTWAMIRAGIKNPV